MTIFSGKEFNDQYPNTKFYKILTSNYQHHNFTYRHGLNIDYNIFNPTKSCSKGGLYFTELNKIPRWIYLDSFYIAKVTIPLEASIYVEKNSFKADQFILDLDNKVLVEDFYIWSDNTLCKLAVQYDGYLLRFVKNQTEEICKLALQKVPASLQYIKEQTDEQCEFVIKKDGTVLQYIKNQTDTLCKLAVIQNGIALYNVKNQTSEICKLAVCQDGMVLRHVKNQTDEICKLSVQQNGLALQFVINQTPEICEVAVQQNDLALQYVLDQPNLASSFIREQSICAFD